jgi:hypothetical protein
VKELETKLAELTRDGSTELSAAREEAGRLRHALAATKTRVLSLRDSLTAVAEEIDIELSHAYTSQDHNADATRAGLVSAIQQLGDSCANDSEQLSRESARKEFGQQQGEARFISTQHHETSYDITSEAAGSYQEAPSAMQRQDPGNCESFPNSDTSFTDLAVPAPTEHFQHEPTAATWRPLHVPPVSDMVAGSRAAPTLLLANTPEEQPDISTFTLPFPPGVITFPSVFSAHISIIQFFANKSSAYAHRAEAGGAEAYV